MSFAEHASRLGHVAPVHHLAQVGSTNDALAALAADGAPHGTAVLADVQRAGRGRLGRVWLAEPGDAVLLSVLLRPRVGLARLTVVVLSVAVALAGVCGPTWRIKWPNDVLSPDGRKVAGVLSEVETGPDGVEWLVVGVGLNVDGVPASVPHATSLRAQDGRDRDRLDVAAHLVCAILDHAELALRDPEEILRRWSARDATAGRQVRVGGVEGEALGVDEVGALRIRTATGRVRRVVAGDVELLAVRGG